MSRDLEQQESNGGAGVGAAVEKPATQTRKPRHYRDLDGNPLFVDSTGKTNLKAFGVDKFDADMLEYWHGSVDETLTVPAAKGKRSRTIDVSVCRFDPENPAGQQRLRPSRASPACEKCQLHTDSCVNPFMPFTGSKAPVVTIILEGVTRGDDNRGEIATNGEAETLKAIIRENEAKTGVKLSDVRWLVVTRCSNHGEKQLNLKSRAAWCRLHVIDDLRRHPPRMIIPVGTTALGQLSHKSSAQEWSGRLLTYRGWPDDWLTNPKYAKPRPDPRDIKKQVMGHPVFGPVPDRRTPLVPLQAPRLVFKDQNPDINARYRKSFVRALTLAKTGVTAPDYHRPWYRFTDNHVEIEAALREIISQPGLLVCYDTETSGLRPWETKWTHEGGTVCVPGSARIVSMMFRWIDPATNGPKAIGFPWETARWNVYKHIGRLKPLVWQALTGSQLVGHNLTFDALYSWAAMNRSLLRGRDGGWNDPRTNKLRDQRLCALADACRYDTWHMAFAHAQKRGSLGLEALAYDWVPDLAGYEEDFTLLIELNRDDMHPAAGKDGHYLNCPKNQTRHLEAYVMGDVEVAYRAYERIKDRLADDSVYSIPIADPARPGQFRLFQTNGRAWIYENIMSPSARVLTKMMARGIFIDQNALSLQTKQMPATIDLLRKEMASIDQRIVDYVEEMRRNSGPEWELDLENKTQLRELLFNRLELPVLRLTKAGKKILGDDMDAVKARLRTLAVKHAPELRSDARQLDRYVEKMIIGYAAVDKFTLNKLTVQFENLRPLRKYRKLFKLYSTYVRPLQNVQTFLDKKARKGDPHLCYDGCIHASFMLCGTRSGRLSARDPNLQNLPRDGEVKSMFVSRFGARGCVYNGDLSQIELRLLAAASGDPTMVKAYFDNVDLHTLTASRIFNRPYEEFSKEHMKKLQERGNDALAKELDTMRNISKTANFLTGYGGGAFGLQNVLAMKDIDKPLEECEEIINLFFDSYPAIKKLLSYYKRFIEENGCAVSIFGRVRVFEEVNGGDNEARSKALRAGCNHLIQSTASDMMLTALFCIESLMRDAGLESLLVSTVHDSLLIDCVRAELPVVHRIVTDVLNNFPEVFRLVFGANFDASWLLVPFTGDCEVGTDYLNLNKIDGNQENVDWDKLLHEDED